MSISSKKRIGIIGGQSHPWISVDRTRRFYLEALQEDYDFIHIDSDIQNSKIEIDLLINFYGVEGWINSSCQCPKLFCIHGGAILNEEFLIENLAKITDQDALVVTCKSDVEIIKSLCKDKTPKIFLLPLPVNQNVFFSIDKKLAKSVLELEQNTFYVGLVSRLLPQKNPHIFLQILNRLKKESGRKIKAFVIGDYWVDYPVLDYVSEDYPNYLEQLIDRLDLEDDLIVLPGSLTDVELNCFYNAMDLLIHPTNSLDENFGYVPVEAMACSTPVVGAWYGGLKDTINDIVGVGLPTYTTNNGIRIDIEGSFSKIIELIQNNDYSKINENCLNRVTEFFSYEVFKKKLNEYVSILIKEFAPDKKIKIQTIDKIQTNEIIDYLPATTNGIKWTYYRSVVEKYVSHNFPIFEENDYVYQDCNYIINETIVTRDDPAWPAIYNLSAEEMKVFNYSKEEKINYNTCIALGFEISTIQKLINEGVLVISKNKWR